MCSSHFPTQSRVPVQASGGWETGAVCLRRESWEPSSAGPYEWCCVTVGYLLCSLLLCVEGSGKPVEQDTFIGEKRFRKYS